MKNIKFLFIVFALLISFACEEGFDEMNTNPVQPTSIDPAFVLNNAIIASSFPGSILPYEFAIVQQIVTPFGGVLAGGNYNVENREAGRGIWNRFYRDVFRHATDAIARTQDVPERQNLYHMARIIKAHAAMILTDTYGDVPYSEAGLGFLEGTVSPVYDTQQSIYDDVLSELESAVAGLSASNRIESVDVLYGGDINKWKRFGSSLMLRAAMRLIKKDINKATEFINKARNAGLMQSNEDNAVIRHTFNYTNAVGNTLNGTERNNYYLAEPFLKYLQDNNDPRLQSIAVRYVGADSGPKQSPDRASTDPADQVGFPMGYDNGTIGTVVQNLGLASFYDFSQVDRTRMAKIDAPLFLVTYAQTELLLADAISRNIFTGDAATHYTNGIRAHMEQLADYGETTAVPASEIDDFIDNNPLNPATALEEINTQYWVASFLNGPETFANFRRTGFPVLSPNPYPGSEITSDFINRLTYPADSESSVNRDNLNNAIQRQGPDRLDTEVWWAKD